MKPRRTEIGEEPQRLADCEQALLGPQVARQRVVLRAADRTHDRGVCGLSELERRIGERLSGRVVACASDRSGFGFDRQALVAQALEQLRRLDRKSTRLNSSHVAISYAVFCL